MWNKNQIIVFPSKFEFIIIMHALVEESPTHGARHTKLQ